MRATTTATARLAVLLLASATALQLAPAAAAQSEPSSTLGALEPTLAVEPSFVDTPDGTANVTLVLRNPTNETQRYHLSFDAPGARASIARPDVVVAAGAAERVAAAVTVDGAPPGEHRVTFLATRLADVATADTSPRPPPLRAELTVRVVPPPDARPIDPSPTEPGPQGQLRLVPLSVSVEPGGRASGTVVVRNTGQVPLRPTLVASAPPGMHVTFAQFADLPPGAQVEVPYGLTLDEGVPEGPRRIEILARGFAAPSVRLQVEVGPRTIAPPPDVGDDASGPGIPTGALVAGAAGLGVAGVGAAAWATRRDWWPLLLALYTRLRPSKLLDHPIRAKLVEIVRARPGISFGDLSRALGVAPGQLTHDARMLEKARIVFSSPDGQTRRFYLIAEGHVAPVAPLAQRALDLVRASPRRASDVARELGVSRQALHYHVKQLVAQGQIVARPDGRELWLEAPSSVGGPQAQSAQGGVART